MIYLCLTHIGLKMLPVWKLWKLRPDKCSSHSGAVFFDFSLEASQRNVQDQFPVFDTSSDWYWTWTMALLAFLKRSI